MFTQFLKDAMGPNEHIEIQDVGERCLVNSTHKLMKFMATFALIIITIQASANGFSDPDRAGKLILGFSTPTIIFTGMADIKLSKKTVIIALHMTALILAALNIDGILQTQHMGYILLGVGLLYFAVKTTIYCLHHPLPSDFASLLHHL